LRFRRSPHRSCSTGFIAPPTRAQRRRREAFVEGLLARLPSISFDAVAARIHARLSAELATKGTAVGPHDLIIAATALAKGYIVTTRDERSFPRISGWRINAGDPRSRSSAA
jgi:tRNA(fMet)-specific endonuclease VapC